MRDSPQSSEAARSQGREPDGDGDGADGRASLRGLHAALDFENVTVVDSAGGAALHVTAVLERDTPTRARPSSASHRLTSRSRTR